MYIVEVVKTIEARKKEQHRAPTHAMLCEVLSESTLSNKETRDALNEAVKNNLLRHGRTINSLFVTAELK